MRLRDVLAADARVTAAYRGEPEGPPLRECLRLAYASDAFLAQALYRLKAHTKDLPIIPRLAHRFAMSTGQISIGDPVHVAPGVYIVHGQVVIDGITRIGSGVTIAPFVTIGLKAGNLQGPTIEDGVQIGTGAKIIGPVRVGTEAVIGANAVVVDDVAPGTTVVGAPARPVASS
jgi:serine O-acetyltransferase